MYIDNENLIVNEEIIATAYDGEPDGTLVFKVNFEDTRNVYTRGFADSIILNVTLPPNLDLSSLFDFVFVEIKDGKIIVEFIEWPEDDVIWPHLKWAQHTFAQALASRASQYENIQSYFESRQRNGSVNHDTISVRFHFDADHSFSIQQIIHEAISKMSTIIHETEIILSGGILWKKEYESNEILFCEEVLVPLLKKMKFLSVRYMHGRKEYGKDIVFSRLSEFETMMYFALQAKAGDISGEVNSEIDQILGQLEDAFSMPFYELGTNQHRFISVFIVAISGHFSENAREKIVAKIPNALKGSVYFLDKTTIIGLINKYWDQ